MWLEAFTIRDKLVLISMVTSMVVLAIACGVFFVDDALHDRSDLVRELTLRADIIAANSTAALAFDDEPAAKEILGALASDRHAVRALLYARDGHVLTTYRAAGDDEPAPALVFAAEHHFTRDRLVVWQPVRYRGERLGTLYLESDLTEISDRLYGYAVIVGLVMLVSGLVAYLLSARLQRVISEPIGDLVRTAHTVSAQHDYSLRVANHRQDELGVLIDGFNEMLAEVEHRDRALVTAHEHLELRVSERTADLRQEIAEREEAQAELERARDVAESATRAKSTFLANMSHEIRTPMNVIIGMTDMVLDTDLAPAPREHLQIIRRATFGLLGIINDVLDSAKIESGKLTIELVDVDLTMLVGEVRELFESKTREKGLGFVCTLAPDLPAHVRADPVRLKQVLVNLISNAVKFTETGGITVDVGGIGGARGDIRLRATVRDTGIGIPSDRLTAVFESFTQADESMTRTYGGTGLGLSICQQLIDLMGGEIGVESEVGRGSTFWFELPVEALTESHRAAS
jgi:signal transduction histidine kinase